MSKTRTSTIHFPGWQFWIFSLTVNFIVLAIQPLATQAQAETDTTQKQEIANNGQDRGLEPKIMDEINRVRTAPQDYARWLEVQRQYYDGIWLRLPGEKPVRTNRGRKALEEAIAFLKEQQPLPPLKSSSQVAAAATSELKNFANSNNIQYFSYGRKTATGIVMDLVVDELFPDRRRRQSLLSPAAEDTGVVCKPDPRYAKVCAIAYSDSPALENLAEAPENVAIAAESPTPENTLPATEISELPTSNSANSPTPEAANTESEAEPATVVEEQPQPQAEPSASATLPVPPQPQVPTTAVSNEEPEPDATEKAKLESELEIARAETEIEQEQQELANADDLPADTEEVEAEGAEGAEGAEEAEEAEEDEPEEIEEVEEIEDEPEELEEAEVEEDEPEEIEEVEEIETEALEETPVEVAINTETAGFTEKIEQGKLETGDRVIADDGSLYDFYPLQGKEGESFTIYLESDDFDTFVALVDSNGQTIGENDDISQEDSNSQIEITLPADGVYNVIVNTYDENGTGEYTLKVSQ